MPVVRTCAPGSDFPSRTATFKPRSAAVRAQARPAKLPPTMTRSNFAAIAFPRSASCRVTRSHGGIAAELGPQRAAGRFDHGRHDFLRNRLDLGVGQSAIL